MIYIGILNRTGSKLYIWSKSDSNKSWRFVMILFLRVSKNKHRSIKHANIDHVLCEKWSNHSLYKKWLDHILHENGPYWHLQKGALVICEAPRPKNLSFHHTLLFLTVLQTYNIEADWLSNPIGIFFHKILLNRIWKKWFERSLHKRWPIVASLDVHCLF